MNILNKIKNSFSSKKLQKSIKKHDTERILKEAIKSPYKDVRDFAQTQINKIKVIDETKSKLLADIEYYKEKKKEGFNFLDKKLVSINSNIERYSKIKAEYDERQKEKEKNALSKITENYNTKKLKNTINKYGFDVSFGKIVFYSIGIILGPVLIGYVYQLQLKYLIILGGIAFISIPAIIYAFYRQKFNDRRFEMVIDYLTNILPVFTQKAKITYALEEVKELVNYQMRDVIIEATEYIEENVDDANAEHTALEMIEVEFPNSRIKAVHKLMETIEFKNSTNFKDVCQEMYNDIDSWIRRVNDFCTDLKDRRKKIIMLCGVTLAMNCIFVFLYTGNEFFNGFTDNPIYQVVSMFFIILIILIGAISLAKLNGSWLIDDTTITSDDDMKKEYLIWEKGKQKTKKGELGIAALLLGVGGYALLSLNNYVVGIAAFIFAFIILTTQSRKYNNAYKKLIKHFAVEFPAWLREIILDLHAQPVLNAIEESQYTCSYPMFRQLELFLEKVNEKPDSIQAYSEMLHDFDLKDARSTMKVLYSVQMYGKDEIKDQVSSLITRNQEMLGKAESLKNQSQLAGIEAIGYLPMLVLTMMMLINMFMLFGHMMSMLGSAMGGGF